MLLSRNVLLSLFTVFDVPSYTSYRVKERSDEVIGGESLCSFFTFLPSPKAPNDIEEERIIDASHVQHGEVSGVLLY